MNFTVSNMIVRNQISPRPIYINIPGSTGYTGPIGSTGTSLYGPTGPSYLGDTGCTGPTGMYLNYTGATGKTGDTGPSYTGDTGPIGYTGYRDPIDLTGYTGITGSEYYGPTGYSYTRNIDYVITPNLTDNNIQPNDTNPTIINATSIIPAGYYYATYKFNMIISGNIYISRFEAYLQDSISLSMLGIPCTFQDQLLPITTDGIYYESGIECIYNGRNAYQLTESTYVRLVLILTYINEDESTTSNVVINNVILYNTNLIE